MLQSVLDALQAYIHAATDTPARSLDPNKLLKISKIATLASEPVSTIRYWTSLGLITYQKKTKGGMMLYHPDALDTISNIQKLQKERYTLAEIKKML